MIDIIIIQINGLILVAKPIKNETIELVLPIISERGIRLEYFHRSDSYAIPKPYLKTKSVLNTNCGGPAWI